MIANEDVLNVFLSIQNIISPDISIEVGAFNGDFSKQMVGKGIEVYAFEASPYVYNRFKDELFNINYINKAVSDKNETVKFEIQSDLDPAGAGNNSIKNRNEKKDYFYVDVESVSLDKYFKDKSFARAVLWIDAEGAGGEVLKGAENLLKNTASIYMELEEKDFWIDAMQKNEIIEYLNKRGFSLVYEVPCYTSQVDAIFVNNLYLKDINEIVPKPDLAIS